MANFEAFRWNFSLSTNSGIGRSVVLAAAGAIKKRFGENATLWPSWNADSSYMLNDRIHLSNQS